jgi:mannose-6-phosphate isomerase-like protein (cupin superfamily)
MLTYKQQDGAKLILGEKEMNLKVFELNNLLCQLEGQGGHIIDFIRTRGIQAGVIRLHAGEKDTQEPHSVDEVYYVIEGNGYINLDGKDHQLSQGTCIFVPAVTGSMGISKIL